MALAREHGHRVMEDVASTLHALIQPARTMLILLDRYRERLPPAIVDRVNDGDVEFIGVFCQMMGAGHAYRMEGCQRLGLE